MSSQNPLEALVQLSQDFPKYSAAIARKVDVPQNIRARIGRMLDRGFTQNAIYINGKAYLDDELNAFS
jgi:UDP-glucose:glycoprotein glucosyltransferase